ncbi:MAG: SIR2 family NAD-dependent protein deacylase [Bacteroidales bacterium]
MKTIVVLTGAGISAESGIKTFRDSDGLWEEYRIEDVATFEAWQSNQELVLDFYNQRRKQLMETQPNVAHFALQRLEDKYNVEIITQNVDDLHERAGSKNILHLHGELKKVRSTIDDKLIYDLQGWELKKGDLCEKGSQLRPHIVWFGEEVPQIIPAAELSSNADIFIIIGTSLNVYPAAGLLNYVLPKVPKYIIDPNTKDNYYINNLTVIKEKAGIAVVKLVEDLLKDD